MTISIVLADDETLLRKALASLLPLEGDIEVVAEAADGKQAVSTVLAHLPDVLVIDLEMPGSDGLDAVEALRQERSEQAVLMLTRHARPGVLRKALSLGIRGFVSKSADPAQIVEVVVAVHEGRRWIDPDVSAAAVMDDCPLTDREIDVLRVTSNGYSVADISEQLHLAQGTVRNYLSNAISKTNARTRHDAARYARENDWL
ncbi:two component transcriptional regulator, LuxR family [Brevibacterium sandarakinum]|uniref:Two component transcriptional regulator, LuxR family n=1 Tax=Brevibacterium sandarakinum TaxID=629680 RepID=A0A1H1QDV8_BRESA|nr:response regulator transcription factor [Brevibacterium sandarakinum]MDN5587036.1 response regulator transcription factor [Brevibacterium sp.]MDN5658632.1 response regulator transcription factor [Brevibacterium sandarakinum]SDS21616.1 two component transcriptional regulator, LuxR family [Brevibacterium sandarakinum]